MAKLGCTLFFVSSTGRRNSCVRHTGEVAGFDFAVISDHFHPWLSSHTDSPFAWSVLGAVADRTNDMELATLVTCPMWNGGYVT